MRKKATFILGDFNDNLFANDNKLGKIIKHIKFTQIINKPTRVTSTAVTSLDLAITNRPEIMKFWDVVPQEIGDHDHISITVDITKPKRPSVVRSFRHLRNYPKTLFVLNFYTTYFILMKS